MVIGPLSVAVNGAAAGLQTALQGGSARQIGVSVGANVVLSLHPVGAAIMAVYQAIDAVGLVNHGTGMPEALARLEAAGFPPLQLARWAVALDRELGPQEAGAAARATAYGIVPYGWDDVAFWGSRRSQGTAGQIAIHLFDLAQGGSNARFALYQVLRKLGEQVMPYQLTPEIVAQARQLLGFDA